MYDTVVPPLPSGSLAVTVTANLPPERVGLAAIGVHLSAPPRPPQRPQPAITSARLEPPTDAARPVLRLAPREPAAYSYRTFAVLTDSQGAEELQGEPVEHAGETLELSAADFPVDFVALAGEPGLLATADLRCTLRRPDAGGDGGREVELAFEITPEHPERSLALPRGELAAARLTVEAVERASHRRLLLGPLPAADMVVDRLSFREYGPQRVTLRADLAPGDPSVLVELLPEGADEAAEGPGRVLLRPEAPTSVWSYFAESPFAPGYRFRVRGPAHEPAPPWSEPRSPFEPLTIEPGALAPEQRRRLPS